MDKIDIQISELEKKISIEKKVKSGAESMRAMLKDKNARGEIEVSITESQKRLDFLEGEKQKLVMKKNGQDEASSVLSPLPSQSSQPRLISDKRKSSSSIDNIGKLLSKGSSGFLGKFGLSSTKSSAASNTSAAGSNLSIASPPLSPLSAGISLKRSDSTATTNTTATSNRKQYSNFDMSKSDAGLTPEKIAYKIQTLKAKMEVEARVKTGAEKMIQVFAGRVSQDLTLQERKSKKDVEDKLKDSTAKFQLLKTALQRYQAMHVDGLANLEEVETSETDLKKSFGNNLKVNVFAARNLMGKKSSKSDAYVVIRVDDVPQFRTKTKSKSVWNERFTISIEKANDIEFTVYDGSDTLLSILFFKLSDLYDEITALAEISENTEEGVEYVWDMEPAGQIQLRFRFTKDKREEGLQRNAGVKRRKMHVVNGHKFSAQQFYGFMKCALCQDYIMTGVGYQCESCKFLCHKKCFEKVVTKCISRANDADGINKEQSGILKHNVPHRFEKSAFLTPSWCSHCGYMLPIGAKKIHFKCHDCSVCCHDYCKVYIPNLCGMSLELANELLASTLEIEKKRKQALKDKGVTQEQLQAARQSTNALNKLIANSRGNVKVSLDDFTLISVLGKGNFGKVMLAEEKTTKNLFAIKVLKKDFIINNDEIESTRAEKRVFVTINSERHPFLVGLHSCFQTETRIYFVMEYINGGDLMLHIQRQQFSEKRAKFYACEILLALEFFHRKDIVYRDLKLDNILLTPDGHIKLADYGLCKEEMGFGVGTNTFCGTPEFMAPEILLEQDYGRPVDWWAFGVLIYEMLLGQAPFKGQDEDEIFASIIEDEVLYPVNMHKDSVSIVQSLLIKDPAQRLGSQVSDAEEIKAHGFFDGINWDDIYHKRIPPPFIPQIGHAKDVSNFDAEFTREIPVLTPVESHLHEADQLEFKNFTYTAEWVNQDGFKFTEVPPFSVSAPKVTEAKEESRVSDDINLAEKDSSVSDSPEKLSKEHQINGRVSSDREVDIDEHETITSHSSGAMKLLDPCILMSSQVVTVSNMALDETIVKNGSKKDIFSSKTSLDQDEVEIKVPPPRNSSKHNLRKNSSENEIIKMAAIPLPPSMDSLNTLETQACDIPLPLSDEAISPKQHRSEESRELENGGDGKYKTKAKSSLRHELENDGEDSNDDGDLCIVERVVKDVQSVTLREQSAENPMLFPATKS